MRVRLLSAVLVFQIHSTLIASADPANTKYTYYLIAGQSADDLHHAMTQKGPRVIGGGAYASASVEPRVVMRTHQQEGICRIVDFTVSMKFTIRLPKLENAAILSPELRESFHAFYDSAKQHEEAHRSIWLDCARKTEALAREVTAKTCSDAKTTAYEVYRHIGQQCHERQMAFEAVEYKRMIQLPFMKLLSRGS